MGHRESLISYIEESRNKCFDLGKHDCFTFTNGAWAAMHGEGYADKIMGKYAKCGPKALKTLINKHYGADTIEEALDKHLTRVEGMPSRGALVLTTKVGRWITGSALGIANGTNAVFVGDSEIAFLPLSEIEGAWIK